MAFLCFMAEGYALAAYGAVLPRLLLGEFGIVGGAVLDAPFTVALAGTLGAALLAGAVFGVLFAITAGERMGRRLTICIGVGALIIATAVAAITISTTVLAVSRLASGLGAGLIAGGAGAAVAQFAPAKRRSLAVAFAYSGIPAGAFIAAILSMNVLPSIAADIYSQGTWPT